MNVLALLSRPKDLERAVSSLCDSLGVTAAEARIRIAPEPPALLSRLTPELAAAAEARLLAEGLSVLSVEERTPERFPVRRFELTPEGLTATARSGDSRRVLWSDLTALLRGASSERSTVQHTEKVRAFNLGRAVVTSGLSMTKTEERTVQKTEHGIEHVLFARIAGGEVLAFREFEIEFTSLGAAMQPSRMANVLAMTRLFRERAPHAFFDDRLVRLGTRALPFTLSGDSQFDSGGTTVKRVQTANGLELLAEILFRGHEAGRLGK